MESTPFTLVSERLEVPADLDTQIEDLLNKFLKQTETPYLAAFLQTTLRNNPEETPDEFAYRRFLITCALRKALGSRSPGFYHYFEEQTLEPSRCPICGSPGIGNEDFGSWDCGRQRSVEGVFYIQCPWAEAEYFKLLIRYNRLMDVPPDDC